MTHNVTSENHEFTAAATAAVSGITETTAKDYCIAQIICIVSKSCCWILLIRYH